MSGINELFPTTDSLLVNDGSIMPGIEDPLKLGQGIGIPLNYPSTSPVGSPSTDLTDRKSVV